MSSSVTSSPSSNSPRTPSPNSSAARANLEERGFTPKFSSANMIGSPASEDLDILMLVTEIVSSASAESLQDLTELAYEVKEMNSQDLRVQRVFEQIIKAAEAGKVTQALRAAVTQANLANSTRKQLDFSQKLVHSSEVVEVVKEIAKVIDKRPPTLFEDLRDIAKRVVDIDSNDDEAVEGLFLEVQFAAEEEKITGSLLKAVTEASNAISAQKSLDFSVDLP